MTWADTMESHDISLVILTITSLFSSLVMVLNIKLLFWYRNRKMGDNKITLHLDNILMVLNQMWPFNVKQFPRKREN